MHPSLLFAAHGIRWGCGSPVWQHFASPNSPTPFWSQRQLRRVTFCSCPDKVPLPRKPHKCAICRLRFAPTSFYSGPPSVVHYPDDTIVFQGPQA